MSPMHLPNVGWTGLSTPPSTHHCLLLWQTEQMLTLLGHRVCRGPCPHQDCLQVRAAAQSVTLQLEFHLAGCACLPVGSRHWSRYLS